MLGQLRHRIFSNYRLQARLLACLIAVFGIAYAPALTPLAPAAAQAQSVEDATSPSAPSDQPRRSVLRFVTDSDFPPFNFLDDDGILVGFNVDLARAICLELGLPCDVSARPWAELFPALKRREADAAIASHRITASALRAVDFTDRYFQTPARFAALRDYEAGDITPERLEGKSIGVVKGSAHEAYLRVFFRDSPLELYDRSELAREALITGKVAYIFDDAASLVFWLNGTLSRGCCEFRGGPYTEPFYFGDGIAIALAKGDRQLKAQINVALQKVRASGRLDELVQRYFPMPVY